MHTVTQRWSLLLALLLACFSLGGLAALAAPAAAPPIARASDACVNPPTLLAPADGAVLDTLLPALRWNAAPSAVALAVRLQISLDPAFPSGGIAVMVPYYPGENEMAWITTGNLHPCSVYYWRAQVTCSSGESAWSEARSFTTGCGVTLPPAPQPLAPADGMAIELLPVTLQWAPVEGALAYEVTWGVAGSANLHSSGSITTTTYAARYGIDPDEAYEWKVRARTAAGAGPFSPPRQFVALATLATPTATPRPGRTATVTPACLRTAGPGTPTMPCLGTATPTATRMPAVWAYLPIVAQPLP